MKKIITIIVTIVIVMCGAFMVKGYYNDRYVASDSFYTQIPLDEVNEDSWLVNKDGVNQEKGKEYNLIGYNQNGERKELSFKKKGNAEDYYEPGTYIKVNTSKTLVVGVEIIIESDIPKEALYNIFWIIFLKYFIIILLKHEQKNITRTISLSIMFHKKLKAIIKVNINTIGLIFWKEWYLIKSGV